jgi:hypothetical protein
MGRSRCGVDGGDGDRCGSSQPSSINREGSSRPAGCPTARRIAERNEFMDIKIFLFLIVATSLETAGDAIVRMGMSQTAWPLRGGLFLAGAGLLFGYGYCVNLPPVEFGRIVGLYIATLFIVWQVTNFVVFGSLPNMPVWLGGTLIVIGGLIVTFWK